MDLKSISIINKKLQIIKMVNFIKKHSIETGLIGTLVGSISFAYILKLIFM